MNKYISIFFCVQIIALNLFAMQPKVTPVDYVRPQIDTHKSRWFFFSSASRPFGMVSLSPDTWTEGSWNSGYLYNSKEIRCFSHVHCWQLAGVPVMPTTGEVKGHKGMDAYKSTYSHETEIVKPGYHKVELDTYQIRVELTSTSRVGMHRYTYPAGEKANVLFDVGALLAHGKTEKAAIHRISSKEIGGYSVLAPTSRRKKPVTVYFVARFNQNMTAFGGWEKEGKEKKLVHKNSIEGADIGGYASFGKLKKQTLLMKVGISYVSEEQARINLEKELAHWNFDRVKEDAFGIVN